MTSRDKHGADPLTNVPAVNNIPAESNWSQDRGTHDSRTPVQPVLETASRCMPTSPSQWNDNTRPLAPSPVVAQGGTPATVEHVVDSSPTSLLHVPASVGERATDNDLSLSGHTADSDNSLLPDSGSTPALDSSAPTDDHTASELVAISSRRPHTRLQAGVRRPKVCNDARARSHSRERAARADGTRTCRRAGRESPRHGHGQGHGRARVTGHATRPPARGQGVGRGAHRGRGSAGAGEAAGARREGAAAGAGACRDEAERAGARRGATGRGEGGRGGPPPGRGQTRGREAHRGTQGAREAHRGWVAGARDGEGEAGLAGA
eukprot:XP_020404587.1 uncharacterized protein LOC103648935 [Zea mays]